ncbi:type III restriction enzyme [Marinitoga hydrogenitolerans DSM 16785]|uniref:Type III restriction enzyme n=1 Tax=Marinitoga hydrogenitolerans (strain DSM 16785 / JCM 12826 / AT1271) TaxID=1122195 RepID=A0A1M4SQV5_MARH1|nr:DEAD/DEAH box helicase family protein [Marinitoga hydrogenitolerans]SHE34562.1 type III restriction enzyme [Marinitoga hydrogenitolerans DSM 16785]
MPMPTNTLTGSVPLKLAKKITENVNELWESGEFLELVTPTTKDLLTFWFCEPHTTNREINFHRGQKQAILNTIYLHEILKVETVLDIYQKVDKMLLNEINIELLAKEKYQFAKYAIKMATGTGKTWVMNAFLIWQYLNAINNNENKRYSKNFLFIAPGLIVYERLLDSYLGKENEEKFREFETSDIYKNQELFLPERYREVVFAFLQNSVVKKDEIGKKVTGDGMIAIANWHLFMLDETEDENPFENPSIIIEELLPARPGKSAGNSLDALDNRYFRGSEIEYLASLNNLIIMNDEAHHIHENKSAGEVKEVEWQKSLNYISKNKKFFSQIDFSATPYDVTGSGQKRTKHYFPHIVVDFDLHSAIRDGLVKMITIDKRKEIASLPLDFKAIRDEKNNKPIALSDGQKIMIQAGIKKLEILEKDFSKLATPKYPKMLIMCEDTEVVSLVEDFLLEIGINADDFVSIHSNKKGEVKKEEWESIKQRLFNVDKYDKPKIIISVLMLKEGFDVNNVCVIVPLRSTASSILLEQTIGRGLRLMFRGKEFEDIKRENRIRVLVEKKSPNSYLDVLSIIEHPSFMEFYDRELASDEYGIDKNIPKEGQSIGDIVKVELKENYKKYDMYFIEIEQDEEKTLELPQIDINKLEGFQYFSLEKLKSFILKGETFYSEELTVKTTFGDYQVNADLFKANSYNEYLQKLINIILNSKQSIKRGRKKEFPILQVFKDEIIRWIDIYIRTKLFGEPFNPFEDENYRILLHRNNFVTEHIIKVFSKVINDIHMNLKINSAVIKKKYFSEISSFNARSTYLLDLQKTIYEKTPYPSNKGIFEKNFLEFLDRDSKVNKFIKIMEYKHDFATIIYFRTDGLMSHYYPDFLVETDKNIFIIETKASKDLKNPNVIQKQKAAIDYVKRINNISPELRDNKTWEYLIVGEKQFYNLEKSGADIEDIANNCRLNELAVRDTLF